MNEHDTCIEMKLASEFTSSGYDLHTKKKKGEQSPGSPTGRKNGSATQYTIKHTHTVFFGRGCKPQPYINECL